MKSINIIDSTLSTCNNQQELFEKYCLNRGITLDFTKEPKYNAYESKETSSAFIWWIRGLFFVLLTNEGLVNEL